MKKTNELLSILLLQICAQLIVALSIVWLLNGGGFWFLIPWVIGWNLYWSYLLPPIKLKRRRADEKN